MLMHMGSGDRYAGESRTLMGSASGCFVEYGFSCGFDGVVGRQVACEVETGADHGVSEGVALHWR